MSKKILAFVLALVMILIAFAASGCTDDKKMSSRDEDTEETERRSKKKKKSNTEESETETADGERDAEGDTDAETEDDDADVEDDGDFKVGFIFLHDEHSPYDNNFIKAVKNVQTALGLTDEQVIVKTNIPESSECKDAANELAKNGCDLVFADSFGHEPFLLQAAREFPNVRFCQASGTLAHTEKLDNFHNAYAAIHEGRYASGVAAGMKLNEMIDAGRISPQEAKIGFVGAFPYAEVISAYTAFFLGARSVCESVTMDVKFTNSWFNIAEEFEAAIALMDAGCVLISQYSESEGAPKACEARGVPNVAYNYNMVGECPNTSLISSRINWEPYFEFIITKTMAGRGDEIPYDWCGGFAEGAVELTGLNERIAADGTKKALEDAIRALKNGSLKVFATDTWTVDGRRLTEYMADVDTDNAWTPETNVIHDGYFDESHYRSAPYFDVGIDGINVS